MNPTERHLTAMARVAELIETSRWYADRGMERASRAAVEDAERVLRAASRE